MQTLTLKKSDFYLGVARFFGWANRPGGMDRLSEAQKDTVKDCVDSGCRNFYWPPPIGGMESHQWTFLTPVGSVTVPQDDGTLTDLPFVDMPQDFGGFISRLTVDQGDQSLYIPITVINEARMREMYDTNPTTGGRPLYAAERPLKGTTHERGPRRQLIIYPRPDQAYTFKFQYNLLPECLSEAYPFAYGGQEHSETILESCLRIAEERYDDVPPGTGTHSIKFFELLAASISRDRAHRPQYIGYNADYSDERERDRTWLRDYWQPVTYNGLPMESY